MKILQTYLYIEIHLNTRIVYDECMNMNRQNQIINDKSSEIAFSTIPL